VGLDLSVWLMVSGVKSDDLLLMSIMFTEDVVDRICEIHFHTIKNKKVECKKAQPKETVTPANQLQLQKRLLLSGLGLRMPTTAVVGAAPPPPNHSIYPQTQLSYPLAAAAAAQVRTNFSKSQ
jgi:RNA-binding protein Musashi